MKVSRNWIFLFFLSLLAVLSHALLSQVTRFSIDEQLLVDTSFLDDGDSWKSKGGGSNVFSKNQLKILNEGISARVVFQTVDIEKPGYYEMSVIAGAGDIVLGDQPWAGGSVALIFRDALGHRTGSKSPVKLKTGSEPTHFSEIIYVDDAVDKIEFSMRLLNAKGMIGFSEPVFAHMKERSLYFIMKFAIILFWLAIVLIIVNRHYSSISSHSLILVIIFSLISFLGLLMPGDAVSSASELLVDQLAGYYGGDVLRYLTELTGSEQSATGGIRVISKTAHFSIFTGAGILFFWLLRPNFGLFLYALMCLVLLAYLTEVMQLLAVDRSTSIMDFFINAMGAFVGMALSLLVLVGWKIVARLNPHS